MVEIVTVVQIFKIFKDINFADLGQKRVLQTFLSETFCAIKSLEQGTNYPQTSYIL